MTDAQKEEILKLRAHGLSYGEIATEVGLCINTIKSYCRRKINNLGKKDAVKRQQPTVAGVHSCQECGKSIQQIQGRKLKRFCSDTCRMKWWNSHPEMVQRKNAREQFCSNCGKKFFVYGTQSRKYCSHECYVKDRFGGKHHDQG